VVKDYVLWPALAGPFFLYVLAANLMANVARNLWLHTIIFCGHFPPAASVFRADEIATESRARWYVRQAAGSCNIEGGWLFHVLSGNLGHQIEHHLFSDMPSRRYAEIAPRVRALCARHGVPYHTGSLGRQFGGVALRILRLALPGPSASAPARSATALSADQCIDG
jgi:linoleoyl-CoA desaturase